MYRKASGAPFTLGCEQRQTSYCTIPSAERKLKCFPFQPHRYVSCKFHPNYNFLFHSCTLLAVVRSVRSVSSLLFSKSVHSFPSRSCSQATFISIQSFQSHSFSPVSHFCPCSHFVLSYFRVVQSVRSPTCSFSWPECWFFPERLCGGLLISVSSSPLQYGHRILGRRRFLHPGSRNTPPRYELFVSCHNLEESIAS